MDTITIAAIMAAVAIFTVLAVIGWQLDNDTHHKP